MDTERVIQLLNHSNEAGSACRDALLEGAELVLWQGSVPADRMLAAYRRRQAQTVVDGTASIGFDEALGDLQGAGTRELFLGQVSVVDPAYVFMIFMAADPPTLVACLGIARN